MLTCIANHGIAQTPCSCCRTQLQGNLASVPKAFHDARHQDVLAVVDMTQHSYGAGKHAISTKGILETVLLSWAAKMLPGLAPKPALTLMNETTMRYSDIQRQQQEETEGLQAAVAWIKAACVLGGVGAVYAAVEAAAVLGN